MSSKSFLSISQFAERTGLSIKALRLYDKSGLLPPRAVDPINGYRRYSSSQIGAGRLIMLLRAVDMGLNEIAELLQANQQDGKAAVKHLARHLRNLDSVHESRRIVCRHIESILSKEVPAMFTIQTRTVPAYQGMSILRRLHGHETDAFVEEAKAAFRQHLAGAEPKSPFTLIFHGRVDEENDGPIEAFLGCPAETQPTELIGIRTEPAHDEAFTRITKAQWAFPSILAAYDAVACSPEATARSGSSLSCREVYLVEPDSINDDDEICDIAFPLA
ncbi:MAG: MerR family transcriptional regulator [Pseudomonadota bacterium]